MKIRHPMNLRHSVVYLIFIGSIFRQDLSFVKKRYGSICSVYMFICREWAFENVRHVAVCCSVLQCVAMCCSVLQCVAVC